MRRILHISDLHFGRIYAERTDEFEKAIASLSYDIAIVSGDLTQRAYEREWAAAKAFVGALSDAIVIPGNHDIPLWNFVERFIRPFSKYTSWIGKAIEGNYVHGDVAVATINTSRAYRVRHGAISDGQAEDAAKFLEEHPDKFKIVVTHHPFDVPDETPARHVVRNGRGAMSILSKAGPDLFLAGHLHATHVNTVRSRYPDSERDAIVVNAGTPISTRLRGRPLAFNEILISEGSVEIREWNWKPDASDFAPANRYAFERTDEGWKKTAVETFDKT